MLSMDKLIMRKLKGMNIGLVLAVLLFYITYPKTSAASHGDGEDGDSLNTVEIAFDFIPDATYDQIEERLSQLSTQIPLNYNTKVKSFIDYFTVRNRDYTKKVLKKSTYFFPIFEEILAEYGLPDELKYLSIVESGLVATAQSRAAAVGLWQFVYYTGRSYGLHADWYIDERMDPHKSTIAAARHLKSLYEIYKDWELALAAYNCGGGNVNKAIRRSGKRTFWEIYPYLPRETRSYVPQFVAIVYAFNYAEEHNLIIDERDFEYAMVSDTIMVKQFTNLATVANLIDVCNEELELLNPAIKRKAIPDSKKFFVLRLPADKMEYFQLNRDYILDSASQSGKQELEQLAKTAVGGTYGKDKVIHRVSSGDVLGTIAQQYKVSVADVKKWNNLYSNTIRVGQKLDIWMIPGSYQASASTPKPAPQNVVINGAKYHVVQPGDTLWQISKTYDNISIEQIKKWNNLKTNEIKPGQKLVVG